MGELDALRSDLVAEQGVLDAIVAGLADEEWALPTPSPGWNVADQIGHLAYFDGTAATAITDPEAFTAGVQALYAAAGGLDAFTLDAFRALPPERQLEAWRFNRRVLAEAAAVLTDGARVTWYARVAVEGTIPFAPHLEYAALPNAERIVTAVKGLE